MCIVPWEPCQGQDTGEELDCASEQPAVYQEDIKQDRFHWRGFSLEMFVTGGQ